MSIIIVITIAISIIIMIVNMSMVIHVGLRAEQRINYMSYLYINS